MLLPAKIIGQIAGGNGGGNGSEERAEFDDAVAPGKLFFGKDLGEQAVLRWPEERGLRAEQENTDRFQRQAIAGESEEGEGHHPDFHPFRADGDGALAEAIGEETAGHGKQDKGKSEKGADQQHDPVACLGGQAHVHDEVDDQELQRIVVERALELRDDEAPETQAPGRGAAVRGVRREKWRRFDFSLVIRGLHCATPTRAPN